MAKVLEIVDMENGNKFAGDFGMLIPANNYVIPTISIPDGEDEIKFTRSGGQTYGRDYGPISYTAGKPFMTYELLPTEYQSFNKWFRIGQNLMIKLQCSGSTMRINEIKYKGTSLPTYAQDTSWGFTTFPNASTWSGNTKLGFCSVVINDYTYYSIVVYSGYQDTLQYSDYTYIFGFDPKAVTDDAFVKPYENNQPETTPGDPDEEGGYGNGLPNPEVTGHTDTTGWVTFPCDGALGGYIVTKDDLKDLSNFLWGRSKDNTTPNNVWDTNGFWGRWKNYNYNPISGILACHKMPNELTYAGGAPVDISCAGVTFDGSNDVGGYQIQGKAISVLHTKVGYSASTNVLERAYGSFRDFARTQVTLYVPYCGTMSIDPSACIGGTISLFYECDQMNGNLAVQVESTNVHGVTQVLGVMTGNCAYKVPLVGSDQGMGDLLGTVSGAFNSIAGAAVSAAGGNIGSAIATAAPKAIETGFKAGADGFKRSTVVVGDVSGNVGVLGCQTAFVQVTYGEYLDTRSGYNENLGRPSYYTGLVSDFTGFSQLIVHANAVPIATDAERAEIESICKNGIIV